MLSRNYSTSNFFYTENGNNNKCRYSVSTVSTCNSLKLNQSFELDPNQKGKYYDNDLYNSKNNLFCSMDSFYSREKELEDFDKETQSKISEINGYYFDESCDLFNQYKDKINTILENYCNYQGKNYQEYLKNKNDVWFLPIKKMEEKLYNQFDNQYNSLDNEIENKRNNAINNYKSQRDLQKNELLKKGNNMWV